MARVVAYRIGIAILLLLAFWLLWSMAYEVVVALRWAPTPLPERGRQPLGSVPDAERRSLGRLLPDRLARISTTASCSRHAG